MGNCGIDFSCHGYAHRRAPHVVFFKFICNLPGSLYLYMGWLIFVQGLVQFIMYFD